MPGVQYPHWKACSSTSACCAGWSLPPAVNPSTVVTARPSTSPTGVWHDSTGSPSTSTVQAPHSPSPQPGLVPVSPRAPRSQPISIPVVPLSG